MNIIKFSDHITPIQTVLQFMPPGVSYVKCFINATLLNFNGNLKHAAEHMYNKSIKDIFSLKAKIMNYDCINNKLLLKLID